MADVYGDNYQAAFVDFPRENVASNQVGAEKRVLHDVYTAAADAAGTDVLVGKLWGECVVHDYLISSEALGAGVTLQLVVRNKAGTETVISGTKDASTASVFRVLAAEQAEIPAFVEEAVDVVVKIAGGAATGEIKTTLTYCDA